MGPYVPTSKLFTISGDGVGTYGPIRRQRIPLFKGGESVTGLSLGRRLVNLLPVAQRTNAFTGGYSKHDIITWYQQAGCNIIHCRRIITLVIGGNEARPQYLQQSICDASWSTGACILSSVVRAPQRKRQQQQHILESRLTCFSS